MTIEEELNSLREQLAQRDELIRQQQALLWEQNVLIEQLREQHSRLAEQVKSLHERLAKDSHNSHLPPSSDRFGRKPKSSRKKSEKQSGGQPGHPGSSLQWSATPDEVVEQHVSPVKPASTICTQFQPVTSSADKSSISQHLV